MSLEFDQSNQSRCDSQAEDIYSSEDDANKSIVLSKERGDEKLSKNARKRKKRREKLNRLEKFNLVQKSSEEDDNHDSVKRDHLKKYSHSGTCSTSKWLFKLILVLFIIGAGLGLTYFWTNNAVFDLHAEEKAEDNLKGQSGLSDALINDQMREEANAYFEEDTYRPLGEDSRIHTESDSQAVEGDAKDDVKPYDYSWLAWWTQEEQSAKSEEKLERSERADIIETEDEQVGYANNLEQNEQSTRSSLDDSQAWFSDSHKKSHSQPEGYTMDQRYSDFEQIIDPEQLEQARILAESLAREEEQANRLRQEAKTLEETKRKEESEFSECYKAYEERGESIDKCEARQLSNNQAQIVTERSDEVSSTQSSSPSISMDPKVMQEVYEEDLYYW